MKTGDIIITLFLSNVWVISGALFGIGFKLGEKNINLGLSEVFTFDVTIADKNGQIGLDLGSSGIRRHTRRHVDQGVQTQTQSMENTSSVGDNNAGTGKNSKTNPNSMDKEESEMISAFQFVNTVAKNVLVGTLEAATRKEPKRRGETILERMKRLEEEAESNAADEENKVSDDVDTSLNAINSGDVVLIANPRRNINENEETRKENEKGSIGSVLSEIIKSNGENIVQIVLDNAEEALLDHVVPDDSTMTPREQVKRLIFTKAVDEIKEQIENRLDLKRTSDNDTKATTEIDSNLKGPSALRCTCF